MCVQSSFIFGVCILKQSSIHNPTFTKTLFNHFILRNFKVNILKKYNHSKKNKDYCIKFHEKN